MGYLCAIRQKQSGEIAVRELVGVSLDTQGLWLQALDLVMTAEQGSFRFVERAYRNFNIAVDRVRTASRSPYSVELGKRLST